MKKYSIEVLEVLSRVVEVEAVNEDDAIERVRQKYRRCEIVLDDSDYKVTEKLVIKERFWKINAFRPEIKAKRGRTRKFNLGAESKLGRIGEVHHDSQIGSF